MFKHFDEFLVIFCSLQFFVESVIVMVLSFGIKLSQAKLPYLTENFHVQWEFLIALSHFERILKFFSNIKKQDMEVCNNLWSNQIGFVDTIYETLYTTSYFYQKHCCRLITYSKVAKN